MFEIATFFSGGVEMKSFGAVVERGSRVAGTAFGLAREIIEVVYMK